MRLLLKQRGKLIYPRKILVTQQRLRTNYERQVFTKLKRTFKNIGNYVASDIRNGQTKPVSMDTKVEQDIGNVLVTHYRNVINAFSIRIFDQLSQKQDQTQFDRIIQQYILLYGGQKITNISNTTRRQIMRIVKKGSDEGIGVGKIAEQIEEFFVGSFTLYRCNMIARTETHNAASYAMHNVAKDMQIPEMQKRWVATNDGRTRSHHSSLNGTTIPMDEDFIVNVNGIEYRMQHPSDPRGGAVNNINCRCVLAYVMPDDIVQ